GHNLSRRAVLGAGVGACVAPGDMYSYVSPFVQGSDPAGSPAGAERGHVQVHVPERWRRTLAAYRRAEARVAAFKAEEALLPPAPPTRGGFAKLGRRQRPRPVLTPSCDRSPRRSRCN